MATDDELWAIAGIEGRGGGVYVTSARLRAVYNAGLNHAGLPTRDEIAAVVAEAEERRRVRKRHLRVADAVARLLRLGPTASRGEL